MTELWMRNIKMRRKISTIIRKQLNTFDFHSIIDYMIVNKIFTIIRLNENSQIKFNYQEQVKRILYRNLHK